MDNKICVSKKYFVVGLIFLAGIMIGLFTKFAVDSKLIFKSKALEIIPSTQNENVEPIIGGEPAKPGEFPYHVYIKRETDNFFYYETGECGGTLIDRQWIMSAAHCFTSSTNVRNYKFFINNINKSSGIPAYASKIIIHEKYNKDILEDSINYDIALIKLKEPVNFKTASLPKSQNNTYYLSFIKNRTNSIQQYITALGFGAVGISPTPSIEPDIELENYQVIFPDVLQKIKLPLISKENCYSEYTIKNVDINNIFTFGYNDENSLLYSIAEGDSGSPILAWGTNTVIGISKSGGAGLSWGCSNGLKVANFVDWINAIKDKNI